MSLCARVWSNLSASLSHVATVKKLELAEKYRELKKSGRLEKYMSKKRKRNAQRDKRKLPQV